MTVPMVNLRPLLTVTREAWRANLERMFERMQFVLGEQGAAFEKELARAWGARFAVAVGTGTAALELSLRAVGLGESGKEVLLPALTSPFTAQAVLAAGCCPRFADVDAETLLLDVVDAAARVRERTVALLPVHLYGRSCAMAPLAKLARQHGLRMVQDACQAHGVPVDYAGAVAYSFYPTKNLGCLGDGGAVVTDSRAIAGQLRRLRDGGRRDDQVSRVRALNSRLDEMQACYLRAFLPRLAEWNADRVRLAALFDEALAGCAGVRPVPRGEGSVCHLYVVRAKRRDGLRRYLAERGIATGIHYEVPLHLQPAFAEAGMKRGSLPVAERACKEIVSLPLWPYMPEAMVAQVAEAVREFYGG
jgi:dTDP-4-amino-4,6-dideoxygalactose transaminase